MSTLAENIMNPPLRDRLTQSSSAPHQPQTHQNQSHWHEETSTALFHSQDSDPSTHTFDTHTHTHTSESPSTSFTDSPTFEAPPLDRRASCPYDGTCTHVVSPTTKACACGKVRRDSVGEVHGLSISETIQRKARRDSYDDFKRGWYKGWLGDKSSEEASQPWGFSSTHASPERAVDETN